MVVTHLDIGGVSVNNNSSVVDKITDNVLISTLRCYATDDVMQWVLRHLQPGHWRKQITPCHLNTQAHYEHQWFQHFCLMHPFIIHQNVIFFFQRMSDSKCAF